MVGIAFAVGFAAVNTGNNLLFLAWGLILGGIVISGVLSEAAVRNLAMRAYPVHEARVGRPVRLPCELRNLSRYLPAFALNNRLTVASTQDQTDIELPFTLRVSGRQTLATQATWTPARRGAHELVRATYSTAYPFGFFIKSRRDPIEPAQRFSVAPARVPVTAMAETIEKGLGETSLPQPGHGDEFFSLRPYRHGDDMRRVRWRRSAKSGRWVIAEHEAPAGSDVMLELKLAVPPDQVQGPAADRAVEHAISVLCSLAEQLLETGLRVGIRTAGVFLAPAGGDSQRRCVMLALAAMDPGEPMARAEPTSARTICLTGPLAPPSDSADTYLVMPEVSAP